MDLSRKNQDNPLSHPPRKRFVQNFLLGAFHCGDRFLMTCRPEFKEPRWPLLAGFCRSLCGVVCLLTLLSGRPTASRYPIDCLRAAVADDRQVDTVDSTCLAMVPGR